MIVTDLVLILIIYKVYQKFCLIVKIFIMFEKIVKYKKSVKVKFDKRTLSGFLKVDPQNTIHLLGI